MNPIIMSYIVINNINININIITVIFNITIFIISLNALLTAKNSHISS